MEKTKQNLSTFLGLREKKETTFKNSLGDMMKKFKNNQGIFRGERRTYDPLDGYADEPTKRGYTHMQSTVRQQLDWMEESVRDFMNIAFSIEKTNASGRVTAELIVEDKVWGTYSSLELLRLKTTLDNTKLKGLYPILPVRSATELWKETTDDSYTGTDGVYQTPIEEGFAKTTIKESFILNDPHASEGNRAPIKGETSKQVNIGKYTTQKFSGELSLMERAVILKRYDNLYCAVIEALGRANVVPVEESNLGEKVLAYLHSK